MRKNVERTHAAPERPGGQRWTLDAESVPVYSFRRRLWRRMGMGAAGSFPGSRTDAKRWREGGTHPAGTVSAAGSSLGPRVAASKVIRARPFFKTSQDWADGGGV